ncbi:unnamed protein product [Symbiodinium pilosum]|uniref:Uncharacterized protein n=1 Tax=Symbiodinium pilosum TaxID=2952 RepID=A0A812NFE8_SYMPI|nr:unnamed protein product [Symbiodinium pilosum]
MGCRLCGLKNAGQYHKKTTESFTKAAKQIHGDRYDYSLVDYKDAKTPIEIACPLHGPFQQTPDLHLNRKSGCPACSYEERGKMSAMQTADFVDKARKKHGDRYDYSLAQYKNTETPATFKGAVALCADTFLPAIEVHGDLYDYSKVKYVGAREHVTIICPIDGEFTQQAGSHLAGTGCPKCSRRAQGAPRNLVRALRGEFDAEKQSFAYIIEFKLPISDSPLYKVGSGSGNRVATVKNSIRKIGGSDIAVWKQEFGTTGEAIVFEHLAQEQVCGRQYVVLPEFKFPGYSEVFAAKPQLEQVDRHPTMIKFRSGERWNPRSIET